MKKTSPTLAGKITAKGLKKSFIAKLAGCSPAAITAADNPKYRSHLSADKIAQIHAYLDAVNSNDKNICALLK